MSGAKESTVSLSRPRRMELRMEQLKDISTCSQELVSGDNNLWNLSRRQGIYFFKI